MDNVWRCSACETINTGEKCAVCGGEKPKAVDNNQLEVLYMQNRNEQFNQTKCKDTHQKYNPSIRDTNNNFNKNSENQYSSPNKRETTLINLLIMWLVILIVLFTVITILLLKGQNDSNKATESGINTSASSEVTVTSEATTEITTFTEKYTVVLK